VRPKITKGGLKMKAILVSNLHTKEVVHLVRTRIQRETVQKITESSKFDFACGNPFKKEIGDFVGSFNFLYYTKDKKLHLVRITPIGGITKNYEV